MKPRLTEQDYLDAAIQIGCSVAAIKAVASVESRSSGFLRSGEPVILFEGHWFHNLTNGKYTNDKNRDISHKRWLRTYYSMNQHKRLAKAVKLDRDAALKSASWGKFQIMGFNYKKCGFNSLQEFINAMYDSERSQLMAFVEFVMSRGLDDELIELDWASFAYGYNGPGYAKNNYHIKMRRAYENFA